MVQNVRFQQINAVVDQHLRDFVRLEVGQFDARLVDGGQLLLLQHLGGNVADRHNQVLRRQVALDWMSFGSDEAAPAPEGVFLKSNPHPRAYGTFARLLGRYVREEGLVPLEEAIRRLTSLPATNLRLDRRGRLARGYFADVVVFDPTAIVDHATYADPHRYSSGVVDVFVNGEQVLRRGEHTGARPGRVLVPA